MAAPPETLWVRGQTAELARVRRRVSAWAEASGLPARAGRRIQLAVDETVANAIEHGLGAGRRVVVRGAPGRGGLTVTVRYRGARFDPTTAPTAPPDAALRARAKHGYGLHLIRRLVDDVAYRWDRGTNEVRLTVRAAPPPNAS
ncbi:ATP-binding protein [Rubrivirga litoralis]|uniref:ATP-binding protein n=1 Tax=Rubrivirga litoralis TaxID=3075598 RepID=A0ABU3BTR5_9BACT|nr:ATP-binding protein [Rubrivirga sp. F394]MDT0632685.1 ATP-binding protein [Rubrivirga sp. F394]